jgi:hypothetical protein
MHYLIYVSTARQLMSDDDLTALLHRARELNAQNGVTGMLLYKDGSFMQTLEGEPGKVRETYARIRQDPRHKDIQVLREGPIKSRTFDGWSMGFRTVHAEDLALLPGFADLSQFTSRQVTDRPHIALKMMKTFHRNTR